MGLGSAPGLCQGAALVSQAVEKGNATAQVALGLMYANGEGVPQDYTEAMRWYRKAADQGDDLAQFSIGEMYANGHGVPQNYAEALRRYLKAADQGNIAAQFSIGEMYFGGKGVQQNYAEAIQWYRKVAERGNVAAPLGPQEAIRIIWSPQAQRRLGEMYFNGQGVPRYHAEAVKWFRQAADQGDVIAQTFLGSMYEKGQGVPQDYVQAHMWFNLAAAQQQEKAVAARDQLAKKMTPAQIAEAQRLAREWKPIPAVRATPSD